MLLLKLCILISIFFLVVTWFLSSFFVRYEDAIAFLKEQDTDSTANEKATGESQTDEYEDFDPFSGGQITLM